MLGSENFSFSGLKTAVRYLLLKIGLSPSRKDGEGPRNRRIDQRGPVGDPSSYERSFASAQHDKVLSDLCASFQQAIIDVLVTKTIADKERQA